MVKFTEINNRTKYQLDTIKSHNYFDSLVKNFFGLFDVEAMCNLRLNSVMKFKI